MLVAAGTNLTGKIAGHKPKELRNTNFGMVVHAA